MKKIFFSVVAFAAILIISTAFKTEERHFKNLKVLPKDISEQALDSIMDSYNVALGVKCGFCHVRNEETKQWDMASDDKRNKKTARQMISMTNGINKKYFKEDNEGRVIPMVTCYTCHNGRKEPLFRPDLEDKTTK